MHFNTKKLGREGFIGRGRFSRTTDFFGKDGQNPGRETSPTHGREIPVVLLERRMGEERYHHIAQTTRVQMIVVTGRICVECLFFAYRFLYAEGMLMQGRRSAVVARQIMGDENRQAHHVSMP